MSKKHSTPVRNAADSRIADQVGADLVADIAGELGIIYVRVSDDKQSGGSSQMSNCRKLARVHIVTVVAEIEDDGESGDDLDRPGLVEVIGHLERAHRQGKPIAWVILDQADRLSRADSLETSELLLKMRRLGVRKVATPARVFDLYSAMDRTLLQIEADHKNNPYLKDLGRRVLNGMLDTARAGFWTGQKPPFGYKVVYTPGDHGGRRRRSGRLVIDPDTAPIVRELFERYRDGASTRDLALWLKARVGGTWTHQGIYRILARDLYAGTRVFGKVATGQHARLEDGQAVVRADGERDTGSGDVIRLTGWPAIVSTELFAAVGVRLRAGRSNGRKKGYPIAPLAELCRCGACGGKMHCGRQDVYQYVRCARHDEHKSHCPVSVRARADVVLRRVLTTLARQLLRGDTVARLAALAGQAEDDARATWEANVAAAERSLSACEARLATARRRLAEADDDLLDDYQRVVRELKEDRAALEAELSRLRGEQVLAEEGDAELLGRWVEQCRGLCKGGELPEGPHVNGILRELVEEVRVSPPASPFRGGRGTGGRVGKIEVVLPEWLSRVLSTTAGRKRQHANIVLVCDEGC